MTYEPWSVVVVPFPFVDRRQRKRRPALLLSPLKFQDGHGCTLLGMITDARNPRWPTDVLIGDLTAAGLNFASVFRCKLFTLDNRLILAAIGGLSRSDRSAVAAALRSAITSYRG